MKNFKSYLAIAIVGSLPHILLGQNLAPEVEWRIGTWALNNPSGVATSWHGDEGPDDTGGGEDWYHDMVAISENGKEQGYIAVGYSSFINYTRVETNGCGQSGLQPDKCFDFSTPSRKKSALFGHVGFIDTFGKQKWQKILHNGVIERVIQDPDGNLVMVGVSEATENLNNQLLIFNPKAGADNTKNTYKKNFNCPDYSSISDLNQRARAPRKTWVIKMNKAGNVIWEYLYCSRDFDPLDNGGASARVESMGWDIAADGNGGYRVVSNERDYNTSPVSLYLVITHINNNGEIVSRHKVPTNSIFGTFMPSIVRGLPENGKEVFFVSHPMENTVTAQRPIRLFKFVGDMSNPTVGFVDVANSTATEARNADLKIAPNGAVIMPYYLYDRTQSPNYKAYAQGKVLVITKALQITSTEIDLGLIRGFDLRIGITLTRDGGVAVVTSKRKNDETGAPQPNPLPSDLPGYQSCFSDEFRLDYYDTDAFVLKYDQNWNLQWKTVIPQVSDTPNRALYPEDYKQQECLYNIIEAADGGFVFVGNDSHDMDDAYMVKLFNPCSKQTTYTLNGNSDGDILLPTPITTYGLDMTINGTIRIKNGQTLVVSGAKLQFADSRQTGILSRIVVEPGGKLTLSDGAELNSYQGCPNTMWDGVEVWGNASLPQLPSVQGQLIMNQATIANARMAVRLSKRVGLMSDPNFSGGIVTARNSKFLNNRKSVEFLTYRNFAANNPALTRANVCSFIDCQFVVDAPLGDRFFVDKNSNFIGPSEMLSMFQVSGVNILRCSFLNQYDFVPGNKGIGIGSIDATYNIGYTCTELTQAGGPTCPTLNRRGSSFSGFDMGVYAKSTASAHRVQIDNAVFEGNIKGVELVGTRFTTVFNSTFSIPNRPEFGVQTYGIYALNPLGVHIEANAFNGAGANATPETRSYGVVLANSGSGASKIYRNTFSALQIQNQTEEINNMLTIDCNRYNHEGTQFDIISANGTLMQQGDCGLGGINKPRENTFDFCEGNLLKLANFHPSPFIYHFYEEIFNDPSDCSEGFQFARCSKDGNSPITCQSTLPEDLVLPALPDEAVGLVSQQLKELMAVIDNSQTIALKTGIQQNGLLASRQALHAVGPYLSDEVLLTAINATTVLTEAILADILVRNSPVSEGVRSALESKNLLRLLNSAPQSEKSARQWLEDSILAYYVQRDELVARHLRPMLDSMRYQEAISFLDSILTPQAALQQYYLAFQLDSPNLSYLALAQQRLNQYPMKLIPVLVLGVVDELAFVEDMHHASQSAAAICRAYEASPSAAQGYAQTWLEMNQIKAYNRAAIPVVQTLAQEPSLTAVAAAGVPQPVLLLYPNPTGTALQLALQQGPESTEQVVHYQIFDLTGKLMGSGAVQEQGQRVDVRYLASGVYYLRAALSDGRFVTTKLFIER
ncbi:MAG TPA: T9SS type A sorting domain-containing protein [Luteibaculaceae bacterium]|nr:T9SS type A sorting domain-containing protein [Luteibaculaceae bacterium]